MKLVLLKFRFTVRKVNHSKFTRKKSEIYNRTTLFFARMLNIVVTFSIQYRLCWLSRTLYHQLSSSALPFISHLNLSRIQTLKFSRFNRATRAKFPQTPAVVRHAIVWRDAPSRGKQKHTVAIYGQREQRRARWWPLVPEVTSDVSEFLQLRIRTGSRERQ